MQTLNFLELLGTLCKVLSKVFLPKQDAAKFDNR